MQRNALVFAVLFFLSPFLNAAVVAHFTVAKPVYVAGTFNDTSITSNWFGGSATLDDTGVLSIIVGLHIEVAKWDMAGDLEQNLLFSGSLSGNALSAISVTDSLYSCNNTGTNDLCSSFASSNDFSLTDPIIFDLSPAGTTTLAITMSPTWATNVPDTDTWGYSELTLTTSAVPIPSSIWLFGSALAGVIGLRRPFKK